MLERLRHMLVKEFLQLLRDPKMRGVVFVIPLVQVVVFGYAVTTDVRNVPTAVVDSDRTAPSRDLVARFAASPTFTVVAYPEDMDEASDLVDRGTAAAVVRIDRGFAGEVAAGRTAPVQVIADGTDSNTARIVLDHAGRIAGAFAEEKLKERLARLRGSAPVPGAAELVPRGWFNGNLESRNFYVPGVVAILLMLITLMLTSMAVVREKEAGTIEQILVSPITPTEFILGKTIPFAIVGYADLLLVTTLAVFWFDVPIRGSLLLLFAATTLYLMTTLSLGLLISTVSRTQQQAMLTVFLFYFPAVLLSGFMFPIANMPPVVQWFTYANPLRYFLVILRGIFLKGAGVDVLWPQMAALLAMGSVLLLAATRRFRKTIG